MNFNPGFLTTIVLIAAIAVVALIAYAALLSIANRHSRLDNLRKRSDLKGLARVAGDNSVVEPVRLEAVNALAEIGCAPDDPQRQEEIIQILLKLFISCEGKFCQGVIASIAMMDSRIKQPAFREMVLRQISQIGLEVSGQNQTTPCHTSFKGNFPRPEPQKKNRIRFRFTV